MGAADDEELARLMKEIDEFDKASGVAPSASRAAAPTGSSEVAQRSSEVAETGSGSRGKWALIAAVGAAVVGFVLGSVLWFLPLVNGPSMALGSALGGALVAFLSGPPKWMK